MSLQQIQREINEHAKMEKYIEKKKIKALRRPENRCFKEIQDHNTADAFLMFNTNRLPQHSILPYNKETYQYLQTQSNIYLFPLRNTNKKDTKKSTNGIIVSTLMPDTSIKVERDYSP